MKLVKENIEFERGLEPAEAMGIGFRNIWERGIKEILANMDVASYKYFGDKDYSGMTRVLYYTLKKMLIGENPQDAFYHACLDQNFHGGSDYIEIPRKEIAKVLKDYFHVDVNPIFESIEFERGLEPKEAMDIGIMSIDWGLDMSWIKEKIDQKKIELIRYKSYLILLIESNDNQNQFLACSNLKTYSDYWIRSAWRKTKEEALNGVKKQIDKHL